MIFYLILLSTFAMEDLYKLDEYEYHFKMSQGRVSVPAKANKGDFFKATEPETGKVVYFLGTMHYLPFLLPLQSQLMIDHVTAKVKTQLKKDGKIIGTLWVENENCFNRDVLDGKYAAILEAGVKQKKTLETSEFVAEVFVKINEDTEKSFGRLSLKKRNELFESMKMIQHEAAEKFVRGDNSGLFKTVFFEENILEEFIREFFGRGHIGIISRNQNWVKQLLNENETVSFVIAGAGHSWFKTGVPGLLQGEGWNIEQIDLHLPYPTDFNDVFKRTAKLIKKVKKIMQKTSEKNVREKFDTSHQTKKLFL